MTILVGAGGNCIDAISFAEISDEIIIYDDYKKGEILGHPIVGTLYDLIEKRPSERIINCIGSNGDNRGRNRIYEKLVLSGLKVDSLIMTKTIAKNVIIGENCLINVGAQLHHDSIIGNNCVICPGTVFGNMKLENNVFIGVSSMVINGATVGENSIIGAGSVVMHDIPPNEVWGGNPVRRIKSIDEYYNSKRMRIS